MPKPSATSSIGVDRRAAIMAFWARFFRRARAASSAVIASSSAYASARPSEAMAREWASRAMRANSAGWRALILSTAFSMRSAIRSRQCDFSMTVSPGMVLLLGGGRAEWGGAGSGRGRSGLSGGLELVDEPGGVGERELLGVGDAVVAEQAVEVGALAAGDRDDRPHLAGRGGLAGPGPVAPRPGREAAAPGPGTVAVVGAIAGIDAVATLVALLGLADLARAGPGQEPGQLVLDG